MCTNWSSRNYRETWNSTGYVWTITYATQIILKLAKGNRNINERKSFLGLFWIRKGKDDEEWMWETRRRIIKINWGLDNSCWWINLRTQRKR